MGKHFERELGRIKKMILFISAMIEEQVRLIRKAIEGHDLKIARKIIQIDFEIDEMEVEVEEECLKAMALYQPVAVDLRFLIAVIKINNDLERIADQAVNIAQRLIVMDKPRRQDLVFDFSLMMDKVGDMLKQSLDALVNMDEDLAIKVCLTDDEVDDLNRHAYDQIKLAMKDNPDQLAYLINQLLIARHLERLADHTTNIAEEVIYMIQGEIVRHGVIE